MDNQFVENPEITFFKTNESRENVFTIYFYPESGTSASIEVVKEFPSHHGIDRIPFSVIFMVQQTDIFPQRIYKVENPDLQFAEIFLVPISHNDGISRYQAVFS